MRVGDEKDPDEADTVGAITLRDEHINIEGDKVTFDFLGKDIVRWVKTVQGTSRSHQKPLRIQTGQKSPVPL